MQIEKFKNPGLIFACSLLLLPQCAIFDKQKKSAEQIAAERALLNRKTALLERENSVLRAENLQMQKNNDLLRADTQRLAKEQETQKEQLTAELKARDTTILNLREKIQILESETGGRIKQLAQLNAALEKKRSEETAELQKEISRLKLEFAAEKEATSKENTEKQFKLNKEIQDLRQSMSDKLKEIDALRKEISDLKQKIPAQPSAP